MDEIMARIFLQTLEKIRDDIFSINPDNRRKLDRPAMTGEDQTEANYGGDLLVLLGKVQDLLHLIMGGKRLADDARFELEGLVPTFVALITQLQQIQAAETTNIAWRLYVVVALISSYLCTEKKEYLHVHLALTILYPKTTGAI